MIDPIRRMSRHAAAACLLACVPGAHAAPFDWTSFVDSDGAQCKWQSLIDHQTLPKAAGIYPAGTVVAILDADCEINRTHYHRSYVVSFPPGTTVEGVNTTVRAVTRERIPSTITDDTTQRAIIAIRLLVDPFVVGYLESDGSSLKPYHAFRYDLGTRTTTDLGTLAGPAGMSAAFGGSVDGSVVVGASSTGPSDNAGATHAFRWTQALGMVDMGSMFAGGNSEAHAASDDGAIVVGSTNVAFGVTRAFRWTLTNATTGAGTFTDLGAGTLRALSLTPDGAVVIGQGSTSRAFRWTQGGGATDLGVLAGHAQSLALGVSANGAVVVGASDPSFVTTSFPARGPLGSSGGRAFRWTQATGLQDLTAVAAQAGADMSGVVLKTAVNVSRDGAMIGGTAQVAGITDDVAYLLRYVDAATGAGVASSNLVSISFATATGGPTLSLGTSSGTVDAGGTAQTSLTVGPGSTSGEVTLACTGLPTNASCSFSPARVTPAAGGSAVQLSIRTSTQTAAVGMLPSGSDSGVGSGGLLASAAGLGAAFGGLLFGGLAFGGLLSDGLALSGLAFGGPASRARRRRIWAVLGLLAAAWIVAGCGGGGGSDAGAGGGGGGGTGGSSVTTPPGTYTITIQASGSSGTTSVPYTLTVR